MEAVAGGGWVLWVWEHEGRADCRGAGERSDSGRTGQQEAKRDICAGTRAGYGLAATIPEGILDEGGVAGGQNADERSEVACRSKHPALLAEPVLLLLHLWTLSYPSSQWLPSTSDPHLYLGQARDPAVGRHSQPRADPQADRHWLRLQEGGKGAAEPR